jgi:hypothetical protein
MLKSAAFAIPIFVAMAAFWVLTHLPESWQQWLDGKKRMLIGLLGFVTFAGADLLDQFRWLDFSAVLPEAAAARIGFYMSLLMIVIKLVDMTRERAKSENGG